MFKTEITSTLPRCLAVALSGRLLGASSMEEFICEAPVLEMRIVITLCETLRKKTVHRYLIAFCVIRV